MTTKKEFAKSSLFVTTILIASFLLANATVILILSTDVAAATDRLATHEFAPNSRANDSAGTVVQVTVPGKFSYPVVQSGNQSPSGFLVGQYSTAARNGNIGLIAHNYAAGASFYSLAMGDEITVTFSNGSTKTFVANNVLRYQLETPGDFTSFINSNGQTVTAKTVFNQAYKRNQLTFQTCIAKNRNQEWGLIFILAVPKN